VDVLIDRRELLAKARQRRLPLTTIEKDYVLGWVLCGLTRIDGLVFKGGTALAKVYFPETWRLSEDLDFVTTPERWEGLPGQVSEALDETAARSGIALAVRSRHSNPGYLQLKVQYSGPLGKNWLKVDVTPEPPLGRVVSRPLSRSYSDYPDFRVKVECLEEIFAQKIRALVQRKKVRDYFDVWKMTGLQVDRPEIARLFAEKLRTKGLKWNGLQDAFPAGLEAILAGYWEKELGRLVWPIPEMGKVLGELRAGLGWLESQLAKSHGRGTAHGQDEAGA
jgi:predicted nucleotidyltransferase component of viral defense system